MSGMSLSYKNSGITSDSSYGEQEQDANSALLELDKGLRSQKPGEQCEAIVRFPKLFEKYPFPILINSASLKLADVFRTGTNFQRLTILKVMQQSQKHLDKILNVDEFVRRIFSVIHSNDPVARAITLRTMGSIASIISDRKNAHHSVINSLDSHDAVEVEAAIFVASCFADRSKQFATSVCQKLAEMIQGLATPVDMKLKLIPVFQHMHHDATTSARVRELCKEMLPNYPARDMVTVTLHTLSMLAAKSLIDIPQQVELLLVYLEKDPRRLVKITALQDLRLLVKRAPHMWTVQQIQCLCSFTMNTPLDGLRKGALLVLTSLSKTIALSTFNQIQGSALHHICSEFCYHINPSIASRATELLTDLALWTLKETSDDTLPIILEACTALEALVLVSAMSDDKKNKEALKVCLLSVVKLSEASSSVAEKFLNLLSSLLNSAPVSSALLLCDCLAAVSSYNNESLQSIFSEIQTTLKQATESGQHDFAVTLCTLVFQATAAYELPGDCQETIMALTKVTNYWQAYKVARQATRYGHHEVAAGIFKSLFVKVSSEQFLFWLTSLHEFCIGETSLRRVEDDIPTMMQCITQAAVYYHRGLSSLRAAGTPTHPLHFQCDFIKLRVQQLEACAHLLKACCSFRTNPPPAIAVNIAMTTGQEIQRCGRVVGQLQQCASEFENLHTSYGHLSQASFDADPVSLGSLQLLQHCCLIVSQALRVILQSKNSRGYLSDSLSWLSQKVPTHSWQLYEACQDILQDLQKTLEGTVSELPIAYQHMDFLERTVLSLIQVPLCFPRYFYQSLQATSIKLAISPQPRSVTEPVSITHDTHLTLKIEGVIQHGKHPGLFRKIHSIQLGVHSVMQTRGQALGDMKLSENPSNSMTQVTEPHNDYFSAHFLLTFPVPGIHTICIEAAVIDEQGNTWKTGPRSNLVVESYDEAYRIQQQYVRAQQRNIAHSSSTSSFVAQLSQTSS